MPTSARTPSRWRNSIVGEMENYFNKAKVNRETLIQPVMIYKANVDSQDNWGNRVKK